MSEATPPAVELRGIIKRYGAVVANDNVNLAVKRGDIHAIVGENGAGKSTLMKILAGVAQPDSGSIFVNGENRKFHSPADAISAGIGMVFQHFRLVQDFTVAENVMLGCEAGMTLRPRAMQHRVTELAERFNFTIDAGAKVESLGVGEQQRVEILKVLYRSARIIILDEPTAVLTPGEVDQFFQSVRNLREGGATVILITHKLHEVMELCDSVTVMRQGRVIGERRVADTSAEELAAMLMGVESTANADHVDGKVDVSEHFESEVVLEVSGLVVERAAGRVKSPAVTFRVRTGEIVGIAGVEGNGQTELVETLVGVRQAQTGAVYFDHVDVTRQNVKSRRRAGMAYIPEDRHRHGLILDFSLQDNLRLGRHFPGARILGGTGRRNITHLLKAYDVRPPEPGLLARQLSGGNQQKLVVARELSRDARLLIASQPTRGVDMGAAQAIHEHLRAYRQAGMAILLASSDLQEILSLCDTVIVMYKGAVVFRRANDGLDERLLGWYMAGGDTQTDAVEAGN